jgi:hypothetical protein
MEPRSKIAFFVKAADARSFSEAGRNLVQRLAIVWRY